MSKYIFNSIEENNNLKLYCIKDFNTFIINIKYNIDVNEINNYYNENNIFSYLVDNLNNGKFLIEKKNCDINIMNIFEGIQNNDYNLTQLHIFRQYNDLLNINSIWINVLGIFELI